MLAITDSMRLPSHIYGDITKKELWVAYRVVFDTLCTSMVREMLMDNQTFLLTLVSDLKGKLFCF